jgi:transposase-like protein
MVRCLDKSLLRARGRYLRVDQLKARIVSESLPPGATVNEVAERQKVVDASQAATAAVSAGNRQWPLPQTNENIHGRNQEALRPVP